MRSRSLISRVLVLAAVAVSGLALSACDLNALIPEGARTFTVPADSEVTIPGSMIVGNNPLAPEEVFPDGFGAVLSQQIEQSFSTQDIDKDAVESLTLTSLHVTVQDPEENGRKVRHLGFLDGMRFFLSAGEVEPRLVAESEEGAFDDEPVEYDFPVTGAELADLLSAGDELDMTAEVEATGRPQFATTLLFEVELTVVADVAGALN